MSRKDFNRVPGAKQDILSELSSALNVRAEQIRHRLATAQQAEESETVETANLNDELEEIPTKQDSIKTRGGTRRIPVSLARLRRRERHKAEAPKLKSTPSSRVNIKNYRPGYTWGRGGRVKELRIKCIARKFLYLWQKKTFGRILLSVAKLHYEETLKHKVFSAWYVHWWELVKEWRLGVRAECHYRYKLWYGIFMHWKQFVAVKRIKNTKTEKAHQHYNRYLVAKIWRDWKSSLRNKHRLVILRRRADEFRSLQRTRMAWRVWKEKYAVVLSRKKDTNTAFQFWAYRIQAQHWLTWKAALDEKKHRQEQAMEACAYHNSVIVSRCLKSWSLYIRNRRAKKSHSDFARRVHDANLKLYCFNHWFQHWHLLRSLQEHQIQIESMSVRFRCRWALWRWRHYILTCKERRVQEAVADHHYELHLLRFGLDSFRLSVVHSHIKVMRTRLAHQLRVAQLQRSAWSRWVDALDAREEVRCAPLTEMAKKHYRIQIMRKCLSALVLNTERRQLRKMQCAKADAHHYLHIVPKCLFHIRMFVELEKVCRENAVKSKEFLRESKLNWAFRIWFTAAHRSRDERMMHRMAFLHRESVLLQSMLTLWKKRLSESRMAAEQMCQAQEHYMFSLASRVMGAWTMFVQQKQTNACNKARALRHCRCRKLQIALHQWKQCLQNKINEKASWQRAVKHCGKKILHACLAQWKVETAKGRHHRSLADVKYLEHQKKTLRLTFQEWRVITVKLAVVRRKKIAAGIHHNRTLMLKVVQEWHRYAVIRGYKRSQNQQLLEEATAQLRQLKLSLYMKRWIKEKDSASVAVQLVEKSDQHYRRYLLQKVVFAWTDYYKLCLRKKLIARQSQWFHDVRINAKYFLLWEERLRESREESSKSQLALWQWSLVLQRKVLLVWKSYAEMQQHKKARLQAAATSWRQRLLRQACRQWLTTADSLSQLRSLMAARHQASAVFDSFHLVQRCALHWKLWTKKRVVARGSERKLDPAGTLTSTVRLTKMSSLFPVVNNIYPGLRTSDAQKSSSLKPQPAASSPVKVHHTSSAPDKMCKHRPPPTRPAFLVDSLKRAGLFSDAVHSLEHGKVESGSSELDSTPSLSDLRVDTVFPDYPNTGRFIPGDGSGRRAHDKISHQDWSLSADVMSGSSSTLGPADGVIKPLVLSNSDTEQSGVPTGSSTSHSPHMFTPSTQRSQFSGNPLLYSSPVSEKNTARETGRFGVLPGKEITSTKAEKTEMDESLVGPVKPETMSSGNARPNPLKLDDKHAMLVSGNLDVDSLGGLKSAEKLNMQGIYTQQWQQDHYLQSLKPTVQIQDGQMVLLKPEHFMKSSGEVEGQDNEAQTYQPTSAFFDSKKQHMRRTPRTFAPRSTDQLSGLHTTAEWKSTHLESTVNQDFQKENMAPHRHTPREVFSPRRTAPQGILHKVSDSDGDVSPLNTARSRGTVTFASPKTLTPEEEIINIRDRLRHFNEQKQKLRSLRRHYRQLSDWLQEQMAQGQGDDEDSQSATEELDMLRLEVADLQGVVDSQKPICERLVLRAQMLAQELQLPYA